MQTKRSYQAYISSEEWLQRRKRFLFTHQDCNRCRISRSAAVLAYDQDLHVHHRNYQRIGHELDKDLEALCKRCHEIETFGNTFLPPAHLSPIELRELRSLIGPETLYTYMTEDGLAGLFQ
jgi:hypothetical protein